MNSALHASRLKVFLVEDSGSIRGRLTALLEAIDGVEVVGHADGPVAALAGIGACGADVAVIDLHLAGGTSGLAVLRELPRHLPGVVPIVLTGSPLPFYRDACLALGARHFLDKAGDTGLLCQIIREFAEDVDVRPAR
ncbi:response regulator [Paraburkholderia ferrariae]|uniref:response regulator n=1 Tax=Paraburkholderia ferrariae TaxID=386056 RepID=UPI0005A8E7E7|nr:response regulator [Paraburkholderia ferrariae]